MYSFKILFIIGGLVILTACQSIHQLPMPKGKWTPINEADFIPPNTIKYRDDVSTIIQNADDEFTEKVEQIQMGETQ